MNAMLDHLSALYDDDVGRATFARLRALIETARAQIPARAPTRVTQRDAILRQRDSYFAVLSVLVR
ncbi:MAG: hypothetical protein HZC40_01450 [Chloroflexi bacterium]|nr:hypothetical protein [Chloroflexota bacterium]